MSLINNVSINSIMNLKYVCQISLEFYIRRAQCIYAKCLLNSISIPNPNCPHSSSCSKKKKNAARKCRSLTFNKSTPDNPFSMQFLALSLTDFILEYIQYNAIYYTHHTIICCVLFFLDSRQLKLVARWQQMSADIALPWIPNSNPIPNRYPQSCMSVCLSVSHGGLAVNNARTICRLICDQRRSRETEIDCSNICI